jgi:CMP-N,N'-diacetyllegionaminic acid synthase
VIYCFDLDGTICSIVENNEGFPDYTMANPLVDRIKKINELYDNGHTIIVETARGSVSGQDWFDITKTQLETWGVRHHQLRAGVKFNADFYIDDKGINAEIFFEEKEK